MELEKKSMRIFETIYMIFHIEVTDNGKRRLTGRQPTLSAVHQSLTTGILFFLTLLSDHPINHTAYRYASDRFQYELKVQNHSIHLSLHILKYCNKLFPKNGSSSYREWCNRHFDVVPGVKFTICTPFALPNN